MKNILLSALMLLSSFYVVGQSLTEKANADYDKDKYAAALESYLKVASEEGTSSDLYYNIGNTYYRMGDLGHAILYYERALVLNPDNDDARANLEFVSSKIQTKIQDNKSFVAQVADSVVESQTSNTWATIAAVCFMLLVAGVALYIFASTIMLRKIGFFGGGVMLLFTVFTLICSFSMKSRVEAKDKAIVVAPSVTLSTVPRMPKDKTEEAFILSNGNKVTIVDSVESKVGEVVEKWYDVRADGTHRAWVKGDKIEKI